MKFIQRRITNTLWVNINNRGCNTRSVQWSTKYLSAFCALLCQPVSLPISPNFWVLCTATLHAHLAVLRYHPFPCHPFITNNSFSLLPLISCLSLSTPCPNVYSLRRLLLWLSVSGSLPHHPVIIPSPPFSPLSPWRCDLPTKQWLQLCLLKTTASFCCSQILSHAA